MLFNRKTAQNKNPQAPRSSPVLSRIKSQLKTRIAVLKHMLVVVF